MKNNTIIFSDRGGKIYITPACTSTDLCPEGVLCSSFNSSIENLGNSVDYVWGDEE
jgi:hypothetical protein